MTCKCLKRKEQSVSLRFIKKECSGIPLYSEPVYIIYVTRWTNTFQLFFISRSYVCNCKRQDYTPIYGMIYYSSMSNFRCWHSLTNCSQAVVKRSFYCMYCGKVYELKAFYAIIVKMSQNGVSVLKTLI